MLIRWLTIFISIFCNLHSVHAIQAKPESHHSQSIYQAIYDQDIETLNNHLLSAVDINAFSDEGVTPLYLAAKSSSLPIVQLLITHGADVNKGTQSGWTPLMGSILLNQYENAKALIDAGADLHQRTADGWGPIHLTVNSQQYMSHDGSPFLALLLNANVDVNQTNHIGQTALHLAVLNHRVKAIEMLGAANANLNQTTNTGRTPLTIAAQQNDLTTAQLLLNVGANANQRNGYGSTSLHFLAEYNDKSEDKSTQDFAAMARLLIDAGIDINVQNESGNTVANMAALNEQTTLLEVLIANKANLNLADDDSWTPLLVAVNNKDLTLVETLLLGGANPNQSFSNQWAPLHMALNTASPVAGETNDIIRLLMKHGANINQTDHLGITPILKAALGANQAEFYTLLEYQPDLSHIRNDGKSLLHLAVIGGDTNIVKQALRSELDIHQTDNKGWAAIHYVVQKKPEDSDASDILGLLLNKKANVSHITSDGYTPLMIAAHFNRLQEAKMLISKGADLTTRNQHDRQSTALDYAYLARNIEMAQMITKARDKNIN